MSSIVEELEKLNNPVPSYDPEDDIYEATRAKVVENGEWEETNTTTNTSFLRKLDSDDDPKYQGTVVSREKLDGNDYSLGEEFNFESGSEDLIVNENSDASCDDDASNNSTGAPDDLDMEDEEIDSDEAMGESDEELYAPSLFKSSKSSVDSRLDKEKDTKNQIKLWESLLEIRIKLQKMISLANQLPQPSTYAAFVQQGGKDLKSSTNSVAASVGGLQTKLYELQTVLLNENKHSEELEDEDLLLRQKSSQSGVQQRVDGENIAKLFGVLRKHRNKTLNYWYDKTRLSSMKVNGKSFSNFERPTVAQIEHILSDRSRLIQRTKLRRSVYRVLGSKKVGKATQSEDLSEMEHDAHLKNTDDEIFDDDDFYQQLLRQLIEQKSSIANNATATDSVEMTRQWLKLQRLRSKIKKNVDTKASKGRKVRYHVHSKLVSFMPPTDLSTWNHESRNQLVKSVFGKVADVNASEELRDIRII